MTRRFIYEYLFIKQIYFLVFCMKQTSEVFSRY